jgi:hypothetical protein
MPSDATRAANELRALLRDDALPNRGLVEVGAGSILAFELAVRATLTNLDFLAARANACHPVDEDRRRQLEEDLTRLHSMAVATASLSV